jgi:hypothetical protein
MKVDPKTNIKTDTIHSKNEVTSEIWETKSEPNPTRSSSHHLLPTVQRPVHLQKWRWTTIFVQKRRKKNDSVLQNVEGGRKRPKEVKWRTGQVVRSRISSHHHP